KLAMEDAIVLRDELLGAREVGSALAAYEARRRPEVEALQAAAQASLEWFEGTERYLKMAPVQFTYSLMTRPPGVARIGREARSAPRARGRAAPGRVGGGDRRASAAADRAAVRSARAPRALAGRGVSGRRGECAWRRGRARSRARGDGERRARR